MRRVHWFDAHLDLACMAECGRDMARDPAEVSGPALPASVTLTSLAAGRVDACLGTIFTEPGGTDDVGYAEGDYAGAARLGRRQIDHYHRWVSDGWFTPDRDSAAHGRAAWLGILIEGADPVASPDELQWWKDRGVVAVGLAWAKQSRYAAGNAVVGGLTAEGRALALEIDRLGLVHDVSHLADLAMDELFDLAGGRMMASHSNCRALLGNTNQRHLRDESILRIAMRGGVIGLNLFAKFLSPSGSTTPPTVADACDHVEHVCDLVGHVHAVGLGSDMDGGFSADMLPVGIRRPSDLRLLADELSSRGWSDRDIEHFAWGNWARFWGLEAH